MIYRKGNLLNAPVDVIIHQCNCFLTMGAGIAKQIALKWPLVLEADKRTIRGDRRKLGSFTMTHSIHGRPTIFNLYSQYGMGGRSPDTSTNYVAMAEGMKAISDHLMANARLIVGEPLIIGLPRIGCGLAGGRWEVVEQIILEELDHEPFKVVVYDL